MACKTLTIPMDIKVVKTTVNYAFSRGIFASATFRLHRVKFVEEDNK